MAKKKAIGIGERFLAYFIDTEVISLALLMIIYFIMIPMLLLTPFAAVALIFLFLVAFVAYRLLKDSLLKDGQSLGKAALSIKVVDYKTGKPCTRVQSLMRNIIFFIPIMPLVEFILVITDEEHRRAGDKWANTIVVKK